MFIEEAVIGLWENLFWLWHIFGNLCGDYKLANARSIIF
jgi:hypothetical protein